MEIPKVISKEDLERALKQVLQNADTALSLGQKHDPETVKKTVGSIAGLLNRRDPDLGLDPFGESDPTP